MLPKDKDADAIIRACSYHRQDFHLIMVRSRPYVTEDVQNSLQIPFETSPASKLGGFDRLPQELISMIFDDLDILSYFRFRQVNRHARFMSTLPREYQLIARYGLEGLRGLLRSHCADSFTIMELYRVLITPNCTLCGEFGGFLFLLTATRCCFNCLSESPKLNVISTTDFARAAGISTSQLNRSYSQTLRTVSGGRYTRNYYKVKRPKKLILKEAAITALALQNALKEHSISSLSRVGQQIDQGFMACTSFPWYDTNTGKVEYGVSCEGCRQRAGSAFAIDSDIDKMFSTTGFLSHFPSCAEAREIWAVFQKEAMLV
ncbi:hypothetical protein V491_05921 [Pseudogymnoascus sp. VKM F-3775]|nr:hypothetical protein V491_05921 [Pseudogymnoascus sp. VKM F-3775]